MSLLARLRTSVGNWFAGAPQRKVAQTADAADMQLAARRGRGRHDINASYDAARSIDDYESHWAHADSLDADSANSRHVRSVLVSRSRYEQANNGYADGIGLTYANDVVGKTGPKLRMQTASKGFNQMVEAEFARWAKAVKLRQKLWTMACAKHGDGEGIGVLRTNPRVQHRVKMDLQLYETEQCQTPMLPFAEVGYIDGIKFDEFGNPLWYDILRQHPGGQWSFLENMTPERVPAEYVVHWFKHRRPGQHRGVPECASTLNTGASGRRFRDATVAAAETAADFAAVTHTDQQPDEDGPQPAPFSSVDIQRRMLTTLPIGWKLAQLKAEHPNSTYETFSKSLVAEQARPKNMPANKALCDSSKYNFASGRLDHLTYYDTLDIDRADCDDDVLDVIFAAWFREAVLEFGWSVPAEPAPRDHAWDWPQHAVVDQVAAAVANKTRLGTGEVLISDLYAAGGRDFEDEVERMARDYGKTVDEMREILVRSIFNASNQQAGMTLAQAQADKASAEAVKVEVETDILPEQTPADDQQQDTDEGEDDDDAEQ